MKDNNEFYIGWQPEAPDAISRRVRQFILAVCILVPLIGTGLVLNQAGFSSSVFDLANITEVQGTLTLTPVPFLQVSRGTTIDGQEIYQNILLVARGKHGVESLLEGIEASWGTALQGKEVSIRGYLIYHDGRTLMEVEEMEDISDRYSPGHLTEPEPYGQGTIVGEITDPKCLFGVMKPGYGKPHRSCAARCIAGGIPPVLKTTSPEGHIYYYMLASADGSPINSEVLPFVGDQVAICGQIRKIGDWLVLYKDSDKRITLISNDRDADLAMCR